MNLTPWRKRGEAERTSYSPLSIDSFVEQLNYLGLGYSAGVTTTYPGATQEQIGPQFRSLAELAFKSNAVVFACMAVRMRLFSEARFQFQQVRQGAPGKLFGTAALEQLETPWAGGTTGDLLTRKLMYADLAGNAFTVRRPHGFACLRPDWVTLILGSNVDPSMTAWDVDAQIVGYAYSEGGPGAGGDPEIFMPDEVAHFAPIPDPSARFRGMSWLTPVIREVMADKATIEHKLRFFENGAAQPLDALVATPQGWSPMGDITPGDDVMGPDGLSRQVLGVYPQGEKDIYRVTFSDGSSTECCDDHLWSVASAYDRQRGVTRVRTLREIREDGVTYASGPAKWSIPMTDPVEYEQPAEDLPVDAYLLGLLLGDGSFRGNGKGSGGVSLAMDARDADETCAAITPMLPAGTTLTRRDRGGVSECYFKGAGGQAPSPMTTAIRELDLYDVIGYEKTVPERYMRGLIGDRIALLQGLIDSDGHVCTAPLIGVTFTSTSRILAEQVRELALSLGGRATCAERDRLGARTQWVTRISRLPSWIVPCRLERKRAAYRPGDNRSPRHRYLVAIAHAGVRAAQCIKVDAPDGLYLTDDFIVTHNTPNLAVKLDIPNIEDFKAWIEIFREQNEGVSNAYKTLFLGAGADTTVVGTDLKQLDFATTQGHGETRIAAAAGVPPIIVGLSEGLEAATYSNYGQARRALSDGTLWPLWRNVAGSLARIVDVPTGARLWIDASGIAFLREDESDAAQIQSTKSLSIKALVDAGYTSDSVIEAIVADDLTLLEHSGLYSVQLQPAGTVSEGKGSLFQGVPVKNGTGASGQWIFHPAADDDAKNGSRNGAIAALTEG